MSQPVVATSPSGSELSAANVGRFLPHSPKFHSQLLRFGAPLPGGRTRRVHAGFFAGERIRFSTRAALYFAVWRKRKVGAALQSGCGACALVRAAQ